MSTVYGFCEEALYWRGNSGQSEPCTLPTTHFKLELHVEQLLYLPSFPLGADWRAVGR